MKRGKDAHGSESPGVARIVNRILGRLSNLLVVRQPDQKQGTARFAAGSSHARVIFAVLAALGWAWAVALLSTRQHLTAVYTVIGSAPYVWGFLALSTAGLLAIGLMGAGLGALCHYTAAKNGAVLPSGTRWLLAAWLVPLADAARLAGWQQLRFTFLEPILLAAITAAAARQLVRDTGLGVGLENLASKASAAWPVAVCILAIACAGWWYSDAQQAYDNYLLGYNDFGHFAWRVANTWEGRGFLQETPGLPAFWDHFNPGLALLAPLWGLWPDARLFLLIQAICLALPAPLVYSIARSLGAGPGTAAAWAVAYLCYPAVGQLNLNASYGWHPISLALPLIFAAMAAWLSGRRVMAGAACLLACSFQEDVLAVLTCLCLMMSLQAWLGARRDVTTDPDRAALADRLPWWGWLAAGAVFLAAFVAIFELAPFSRYQVSRFSALGDSFGQVLLSPVLRPQVFWGTVLRPESVYFLLALWVPLGILWDLRRGWAVLAATFLPLGVLVAWGHTPATSLAFQYTTALIPLFFMAAMLGRATVSLPANAQTAKTQPRTPALAISGIAALAACAVASAWFGAMPWSCRTLTDVVIQTYPNDSQKGEGADRQVGSPANTLLRQVVERIGGRQSSVLATGRVASHLLGVRRLDTVAQTGDRWQQFEAEVGARRSPIELFDYIVIDTAERFYQSPEQCQFIIDHASRVGYRKILDERGILVLARPSVSPLPPLPAPGE